MSQWAPIQYREFWDVPRIFLVPYRGRWFLFDCPLDERTEDFPDAYQVYVIPEPTGEELSGSWDKLHEKATHCLGKVAISAARFDSSKRREMDTAVLDELTARLSVA